MDYNLLSGHQRLYYVEYKPNDTLKQIFTFDQLSLLTLQLQFELIEG